MADQEKIILPPKYYLDYFKYLLTFISEGSSHLLSEDDESFIALFESLSEDAQCLLVRMMNRKGEYFRLEKFSYEEIENIPLAAQELIEAELASLDPPNDFVLFTLFTKGELHQLYPGRDFSKKYKEDVIMELAEENDPEDYEVLRSAHTIVHLLVQEQIEYLKLLFFGHAHGMMTEFVIRDIGNVKLENMEGVTFTPWFDTLEEAKSVFELYKWDRTIRHALPVLLPEEIAELTGSVNWSVYLNHPKSRKIGDKFMLRVGEYFEKSGLLEEALTYYSLARKHPARERRIRIHEKLDELDTARELAEVAFESPFNASEKIFAKDYLEKKSKRNYRSTTAKINTSPEIIIEDPIGHRVEHHALNYYDALGYQGTHSENYLWRGFFGLVFWEELFGKAQANFHNPLQRMPSDLHTEAFYLNRKSDLDKQLKTFRSKKQLLHWVNEIYANKQGINNPMVGWHESLPVALEACISRLPLKGMKAVLLEMAKNVKDNSTGFPDLFIWKDKDYHFYEIKSPNDHLSAQQLFWIDFFEEQKIKADILRVKYQN